MADLDAEQMAALVDELSRLQDSNKALLEALEAVDKIWSEFWPLGPDRKYDDTAIIWKQIRAAMAKARGQA